MALALPKPMWAATDAAFMWRVTVWSEKGTHLVFHLARIRTLLTRE